MIIEIAPSRLTTGRVQKVVAVMIVDIFAGLPVSPMFLYSLAMTVRQRA